MCIVEVLRPEAIVRGDANEIETVFRQEIQRFFVHWSRTFLRLPREHPLEIESVVSHSESIIIDRAAGKARRAHAAGFLSKWSTYTLSVSPIYIP